MSFRRMKLVLFTIALVCIALISADDVDDFDEATVEVVEEATADRPEVTYTSPTPIDSSKVYIAEHFDDPKKFDKNWIKSAAKKEGISEDIAKYDGVWTIEPPERDALLGDQGLVLKSKVKHSAISSKLSRPFVFNTKPLIIQYEVLLQQGQECGGAYIKLLTDSADTRNLAQFHDKTPYSIMFGPDKCGNDHKLHFIFRHVNPKNGTIEEKHCKKPKDRLDDYFSDKLPHLYTLVVKPDNTFEISIDKKVINSGSLLEDFTPAVNPPQEIDDPNDKKPADWDEREKIPDPEAAKPDDWDEDAPEQIVDENAVMPDGWLEDESHHIPDSDAMKPDDWDTDMDGEWEPPLIDNPACTSSVGCGKWEPPLIRNPKYKGKWMAPLIDNPNYKGKWRPKRIQNPDYFEDLHPFKMQTISAVGFELWTMSSDILFDNIIITDDAFVAEQWAVETFDKKRQKIAKDSESVLEKLANITNEYPALWALYIFILGIPVVFILYLCCKPSSSASQQEKEEQWQAADRKKTDAVTEDVEPEPEQEPEPEHVLEAEPKTETKTDKPVENDNDDKEKYSDQDDDDDDEDDKIPQESEGTSISGEGDVPRKRKPRKE